MESNDDVHDNMVSNLPLLFANGYPTSLEKITEAQIQNFIPFMVQCSLGNINVPGKEEYSEPEWWPEDIKFEIPITKPKKHLGNWLQKMRDVVKICYRFHKSIFLLRFCTELASYEHEWLRFINNYNSTTSLFDRRSNKLLVTFRNENMTYDQPQNNRKCLLQQKNNRSQSENNSQQQMVEPALFDIYLCDNCDAELYSLEAITEHERTCTSDDDVIICNSPTPDRELLGETSKLSKSRIKVPSTTNCKKSTTVTVQNTEQPSTSNSANLNESNKKHSATHKKGSKNQREKEKLTRRNRSVYPLSKCPQIPLSSPAGQLLIKISKTPLTEEYLRERLERIEKFCNAPVSLNTVAQRPKLFNKRSHNPNAHFTFKKPQDYSIRMYTFPRRHFTSKYRTECLKFLNKSLIKRCRPISVRLRKITDNEIKRNMICSTSTTATTTATETTTATTTATETTTETTTAISTATPTIPSTSAITSPSDLNIKLIRDQLHGSGWKITNHQQKQQQQQQHHHQNHHQNHHQQQQQQQQQHQIVVDTIDLCSSDDESAISSDDGEDFQYYEQNINDEQHLELQQNKSIQPKLQNIINNLNSEVTLTPIRRNQCIDQSTKILPQDQIIYRPVNTATSINNSSSTSSNISIDDVIRRQNKYEGNFLLSQTLANQVKPLQPSVFLFSNYTTGGGGGPMSIPQLTDMNGTNINYDHHQQNQENLVDNSLMKTQDDWLPNNNNNNNIIANNMHRNSVAVSVTERNAKKVLQHYINDVTISSPNRTISIDLTL